MTIIYMKIEYEQHLTLKFPQSLQLHVLNLGFTKSKLKMKT